VSAAVSLLLKPEILCPDLLSGRITAAAAAVAMTVVMQIYPRTVILLVVFVFPLYLSLGLMLEVV